MYKPCLGGFRYTENPPPMTYPCTSKHSFALCQYDCELVLSLQAFCRRAETGRAFPLSRHIYKCFAFVKRRSALACCSCVSLGRCPFKLAAELGLLLRAMADGEHWARFEQTLGGDNRGGDDSSGETPCNYEAQPLRASDVAPRNAARRRATRTRFRTSPSARSAARWR